MLMANLFSIVIADNLRASNDLSSNSTETVHMGGANINPYLEEVPVIYRSNKAELALLDLYSGCGAMSTGLCFGAKFAGADLVTVIYFDNFLSIFFPI